SPRTANRRVMPRDPHSPAKSGAAKSRSAMTVRRMAAPDAIARPLLKHNLSESCDHVKIRRRLHRRHPGAEFVAVDAAAVDAKEVSEPLLACRRRPYAEAGEGNAHDGLGASRRSADGGKELRAVPARVRAHRVADAVGRIDARVEGRAERAHLDLEIVMPVMRRDEDLHHVFLVERFVVTEVPGNDLIVLGGKQYIETLLIGI